MYYSIDYIIVITPPRKVTYMKSYSIEIDYTNFIV